MKKRLLALALTLAMIASMIVLPVGAYDVSSVGAVTATTDTCPCGCGKTIAQANWQVWDPNTNGKPGEGHYYLEGNYVQQEELELMAGSTIVLDLRGYTLTTDGAHRIATVNGHLMVMDTLGGGRLSAITSTSSGGVICVRNNETTDAAFSLYSGTITPDPASTKLPANGGLIFVYTGCDFNMYGGTLLGGFTSTQGGNLCSQADTNLRITGGSIIGGTADKHGGNIYSAGNVTLTNCQVIGGTAAGWGGNIYLSAAQLTATNAKITAGSAICDDTISTNNNGGGNVACMSSTTSSFTNCTITGGYTAKQGGNLFLGSGSHTVTGGTVSAGTAKNANNIYGTGNVTLDGCSVPGDVEYNSTNTLTLKGNLKIGLINTGLNIANTDAQVDVSGLTSGAEIYLNANGVTLENANMDYFKPAIRTTLTQDGTSITAAYAADGETAGYCPHCNTQVAWKALDLTTCLPTECYMDADDDTDAACTKPHIETGHYYLAASLTGKQFFVGSVLTESSVTDDVVVDLNGYKLTSSGRAYYIKTGSTLTMLDSAGGGSVTGSGANSQGGGVLYNESGTLNIYGGKYVYAVSSSKAVTNGGVIHNGGDLNIYGGIIDGSAYSNTGCNGGAIYMANGSSRSLTMSAGHIIGGTAKYGGSIALGYNNIVNITGGSITGGSATTYGGNIYMYYTSSSTDAANKNAAVNISGCAITGGKVTSSSSGGGNIFANWGTLDMNDCYIANGSAGSWGGNLGTNATIVATLEDSIMVGGSAKTGGNMHNAGTSATFNMTDSLIANGKATTSGGNLNVNNGYVTLDGGAVLYGKATTVGGNINTGAGNFSATHANNMTVKNGTLIAGGTAGTNGGNISNKGVLNLTSATIRGGQAADNGQDIYLTAVDKQQKLTVGSGVTGTMLMYVEESTHLSAPVFGTAIAKTVCETLNAEIYLENEGYGQPLLIAEGGALCVAALSVWDEEGNVQWFTSASDAIAAYTPGSILRLATDCEITLTQDCIIDVCGSTVTVHGNYKVTGMDSANDGYALSEGKLVFADQTEANTDAITPVSTGSMYVTVAEGNTATFHRLDFGVDSISIRPTNCGVYYTGVWFCDEVLAEKIDSYGMALSLESMPTANFVNQAHVMFTESTEKLGVGINSTSVLISGIMQTGDTYGDDDQTPVSAANNDLRGKLPIYATAYVVIDGETYISDDSTTAEDDVDYSLYSAMELMDRLITTYPATFRRYCNAVRDFYDIWDEYGMESWDFEQVSIPAQDDVIDVLMIGSSFCYYYVEELAQLAAAAGIDMRVCNAYYSGCELSEHYNWWLAGQEEYQFWQTTVKDGVVTRTKLNNKASLEWCLMQGQWDVLSLQEHPTLYWKTSVEEHLEVSRIYYTTLFTYLREQFPDAQLLFQQTWAYQPGYDKYGFTMVDTAQQVTDAADAKAYAEAICAELSDLNVGIVPSGSAWQHVRNGEFGAAFDNLCARISANAGVGDYYHEGDIGGAQYLNACVWFEVITGLDCRNYDSFIPFYASSALAANVVAAVNVDTVEGGYSLTEEFVNILQECAHKAVAEAYPEN